MNKKVTSREQILETAIRIARQKGISYLSIRKVANECGIAIGSIYNYFPNMEALTLAVAENFWSGILNQQEEIYVPGMDFMLFLEQYYLFLFARLKKYDKTWLLEMNQSGAIQGMDSASFLEGKALMRRVLDSDPKVTDKIWNMELNKDTFVDYVYENLFALLRAGQTDCRFFLFLIEHLLYEDR